MKATKAQRRTKANLNRMINNMGDLSIAEDLRPKMEDIARGLRDYLEACSEAAGDKPKDMFSDYNERDFLAYVGNPLQKRLL